MEEQQQTLEVSDLTAEDMEIVVSLIGLLRRKNLEKNSPQEPDMDLREGLRAQQKMRLRCPETCCTALL